MFTPTIQLFSLKYHVLFAKLVDKRVAKTLGDVFHKFTWSTRAVCVTYKNSHNLTQFVSVHIWDCFPCDSTLEQTKRLHSLAVGLHGSSCISLICYMILFYLNSVLFVHDRHFLYSITCGSQFCRYFWYSLFIGCSELNFCPDKFRVFLIDLESEILRCFCRVIDSRLRSLCSISPYDCPFAYSFVADWLWFQLHVQNW